MRLKLCRIYAEKKNDEWVYGFDELRPELENASSNATQHFLNGLLCSCLTALRLIKKNSNNKLGYWGDKFYEDLENWQIKNGTRQNRF